VGLSTDGEDVDAIELLDDGTLLISTVGSVRVPGLPGRQRDEDLLALTPAGGGDYTNGTWSLYFDGSDVGLASNGGEDVDAAAVAGTNVYLSTVGNFSVPGGLSGADEDVFICNMAGSTPGNTVCAYNSTLYFDGSAFGLSGNDVDAIDLP